MQTAGLDLRGVSLDEEDETVLIAANSMPRVTYAALRVTRVRPPIGDPNEIRQLSRQDQIQFSQMIEAELRQSLPMQGLTYLESTAVQIEEIGGWPAIVFSYRRSGLKGPVSVQIIQIARRTDSLRINLSFRESEQVLWMPVIARIKQSIQP